MPRVAQCMICANRNRSKPAADSRSMSPIFLIGNLARGVCSGFPDHATGPVHPSTGRSRSAGMGGLDQSECLVGIRYTHVEVESAARDPWTGWRCALSLQLSVISGAPVESLRDVSLRRRVHRIARALKPANNQVVHRKFLSDRCGDGRLSRSPPPQHSTPKTWSSKTSSSGSAARQQHQ